MSDSKLYTLHEFKDKVFYDVDISTSDAVVLMCAILIASIGLNMDSTAVIIGAMLISPLMSPILGIGLSLAIFDYNLLKKSIKILAFQILISIVVSTIYFYISPISYPSSEIVSRTAPTIWDVVIAIAGGTAGIIGARKKEANNIVPGVAIATALMPPICTVGYSISAGNLEFFIGSLYLFIINCSFIMVATVAGVRIMMLRKHEKEKEDKVEGRTRIALLVVSLLILIPSIFSAGNLVRETLREEAISSFISDKFENYLILDEKYDKNDDILELTISGDYLSNIEIKKIRESMKEYNLEYISLKLNQLPSLDKIDDEKVSSYINRYIQTQIDREKKKLLKIE